MSADTIGLKVTECKSIAACVSIIRKYRNTSIAEIRSSIQGNKYILCFDYADCFGLKQIIQCYLELTKSGIDAQLYELDDEPTTLDFMQNLNKTYDEISDEIDAEETQGISD